MGGETPLHIIRIMQQRCKLLPSSNDNNFLFCFDFDQTIVKGHFHHLLYTDKSKFIPSDKQSSFDIISRTKILLEDPSIGLKHADKLREVIQLALHNGHHVAITSFTSFPESFVPTLEKLGLSPAEINVIPGFAGYPVASHVRKNDHLRQAMAKFKVKSNNVVWLIDDDPQNCYKASEEGFNAVQVPVGSNDNSTEYLQEILKAASR